MNPAHKRFADLWLTILAAYERGILSDADYHKLHQMYSSPLIPDNMVGVQAFTQHVSELLRSNSANS